MLAGPYATMLLADLGAEVIKVEPPGGEFIRHAGPNLGEDDSYGGYFQSVNRNKSSVVIDLKSDDGRRIFQELVASSDALVENFRVGVMDKLGFGYEVLRDSNPKLVYGCIRGFGDPRTGSSPYVDWPAYDVVAQAMGGLMEITGEMGGEPTKTGPGLGDIFPASLLTTGLLAALLHARTTGHGDFVDVAMYDAVLSLSERLVYQYSFLDDVPTRQGSSHPFFVPFGIFPTSDGWVAIAAPSDQYWRILVDIMSAPWLGDDQRFATSPARHKNRDEVQRLVTEWTSSRTMGEVTHLTGGRLPAGPVQNIRQIFEDPHIKARDMIVSVDHPPSGKTVQVAGQPIKFASVPRGSFAPAPLLGQDTDRVLSHLGYNESDIHSFRDRGVVR